MPGMLVLKKRNFHNAASWTDGTDRDKELAYI